MPENLSVLNLDLKTDPDSDSEPGPDEESDEDPLLKSQIQIKGETSSHKQQALVEE